MHMQSVMMYGRRIFFRGKQRAQLGSGQVRAVHEELTWSFRYMQTMHCHGEASEGVNMIQWPSEWVEILPTEACTELS